MAQLVEGLVPAGRHEAAVAEGRRRALGEAAVEQLEQLGQGVDRVGGFGEEPLMEDVAIARRLGRARLHRLQSRAITSAARFERGYLSRSARNLLCLALYFAGVPPRRILWLYE